MPDTGNPRLYRDGLTGLRAYAACWVMLFHVNAFVGPRHLVIGSSGLALDLTPLVTIGWVGVDLFFVLSGFLLTTHLLERWPIAERRTVLRDYFRARVLRVFPAYWAQLAVLLAVAVIAQGGAMPPWSRDLPLHVPMLHNLTERASFAINPVYWTLPVEFGFYVCLPFVASHLARGEAAGGGAAWLRLAGILAVAVAATWAYRYAVFRMYAGSAVNTIVWATSQLPGTLDQFVIGASAAAGYRLLEPRITARTTGARGRMSAALFAAGAAGVIAMMYVIHNTPDYWSGNPLLFVWHTITATFVAMVILAIVISGPATRLVFENRVAMFLGTVSYSIYLWHFPIAKWTAGLVDLPSLGLGAALLLLAPIVIVASTLSYYAVERPFLRRSR